MIEAGSQRPETGYVDVQTGARCGAPVITWHERLSSLRSHQWLCEHRGDLFYLLNQDELSQLGQASSFMSHCFGPSVFNGLSVRDSHSSEWDIPEISEKQSIPFVSLVFASTSLSTSSEIFQSRGQNVFTPTSFLNLLLQYTWLTFPCPQT